MPIRRHEAWDIPQTLHMDLPVWPGEPAFALRRNAEIDDDCPVNVGAIATPLHAGTHVDAPLHYDPLGAASADGEVDVYVGRYLVIDDRHAIRRVELGDLDWDAVRGVERVLFCTYEQIPTDQWDNDFTAITAEVIDPEQSKTMDAHHEIRAGDMRIFEGLVVNNIWPGEYKLIALPLQIAGADESPVRAILREIAR